MHQHFKQVFKVIGVDPENKKKFVQEWTNNMKETSGPKVTMSSFKNWLHRSYILSRF